MHAAQKIDTHVMNNDEHIDENKKIKLKWLQ